MIGQYYLGWCAYRKGEDARAIFEQTISKSTTYKIKGLIALAAAEARNGDSDSELECYTEAAKYADCHTTLVTSLRAIAVIKAREGCHRQALKDLENITPLVYRASPKAYFDYLNSLAVELGEAGRKDEARNVIGHVLASPYAYAYPEWRETADELKPANRSFVVPNPSPARMGKLLTMSVIEPAKPVKQDKPAGIVNLQQWKTKMGKDKDKEEGRYSPNMAEDKMLCEIVNLFTADDIDRQTKFQMLESIAVIVAKKRAKRPDKDSDKDKNKD